MAIADLKNSPGSKTILMLRYVIKNQEAQVMQVFNVDMFGETHKHQYRNNQGESGITTHKYSYMSGQGARKGHRKGA